MIATGNTTVREIVAGDFRAAGVFHQFGIDFCCSGGRTLAAACEARNLTPDAVICELERVCARPDDSVVRFDGWDADTLAAYIVREHHSYVRWALPALTAHLQKLARAHGSKRPELHQVARRFESVAAEMTDHMEKEERVLFPYIQAIAEAARTNHPTPQSPFASIDTPIKMMEDEHQWVGDAMKRIRQLTDGYAVPVDGCTTYRVAMQELEAFESDLHQHVHLENNILFPKARALARPSFA